MKIALLHDFFIERGGAEKLSILLAKYLNADIYTTSINWDVFDGDLKQDLKKLNAYEMGLRFKNAKILTNTETALRFSNLDISKTCAKDYDLFFFTGLFSIAAAGKYHPNVWMCNIPLRILYDLHGKVYARLKWWQKSPFKIWCTVYKRFNLGFVNNCDKIISISKNDSKKIATYYGKESSVVYPPVETEKYYCKSYEDFYLSSGRLMAEKRVDLIIRAFKELKDKMLIISGDGPERKKLEELAKGSENIKFTGLGTTDQLFDLYARCAAVVYMPLGEPFGLVPVEAMASGKPCIAVNEGGCRETVLNGKTGFLIKPDKEKIKKYVRILTPELAKRMKRACITQAKKFDIKVFVKNIKKEVNFK